MSINILHATMNAFRTADDLYETQKCGIQPVVVERIASCEIQTTGE